MTCAGIVSELGQLIQRGASRIFHTHWAITKETFFQPTKINLMVIHGFVTAWWNVISENADQVEKHQQKKKGWETQGVFGETKHANYYRCAVIRNWNDELSSVWNFRCCNWSVLKIAFKVSPACSHISLFQASKWSLACEEHAVIICRCVSIHSSSSFCRNLFSSISGKMGYRGSRVCILIWLFRRVFQQQKQLHSETSHVCASTTRSERNEVSCCCEKSSGRINCLIFAPLSGRITHSSRIHKFITSTHENTNLSLRVREGDEEEGRCECLK